MGHQTDMYPISFQARTLIVRSSTAGDYPAVTPYMFCVFIPMNDGEFCRFNKDKIYFIKFKCLITIFELYK